MTGDMKQRKADPSRRSTGPLVKKVLRQQNGIRDLWPADKTRIEEHPNEDDADEDHPKEKLGFLWKDTFCGPVGELHFVDLMFPKTTTPPKKSASRQRKVIEDDLPVPSGLEQDDLPAPPKVRLVAPPKILQRGAVLAQTSEESETITSSLEILIPDGRRYGRLVAHRGEYLLQEDSGRDARWSMAEDDGILTAVWLPPRGTGQRIYQDLKDGFHRLGKLPVNHRQRGCLLATVARPDGSNGHRLELMSVSGVDAVLVLLCALGLLTFDGMFEVIDRAEFQTEKAGPAKADPSPALNSSLSAATGTSSLGAAQFASDCYSSMNAPQFATDCYSSLHPPRLATECYSSMSAPQFATDCNCLGPAPEGGSKEDHPVAGAQ
eukprot:s640_g3.t1